MLEQTSTYKEFSIEIHPQGNLGDNTKVFFRVLKDDKTEFTLWQMLSGSEYRGKKTPEIIQKIIEDGLSNIRGLLDSSRYEKGGEYNYGASKVKAV